MAICISLDIDWAPEEVIFDSLELLNAYNVKATLFATHESKILNSNLHSHFEIALHPNYFPLLQGRTGIGEKETLNILKKLYPSAVGVRTHGLVMTPQIIQAIYEGGFSYDSSLLVFGKTPAEPFELFSKFYRVPFHWEDDVHFTQGKHFLFNAKDIQDGWVFNFHPIHIYLNTDSLETYNNAKVNYQNPKELLKLRNSKVVGIRDYFIALLDYIKENNCTTACIKDLIPT